MQIDIACEADLKIVPAHEVHAAHLLLWRKKQNCDLLVLHLEGAKNFVAFFQSSVLAVAVVIEVAALEDLLALFRAKNF